LRRLENAGFQLGVVANTTDGEMERRLMEAGVCAVSGAVPRVAAVVDSHRVGVAKPDPRIFEIALAAVGRGASNCVFVGDTVHVDVRGAQAARLRPVHVDPLSLCTAADHSHVSSVARFAVDLLGLADDPS
jgi:putative hydrolase of the HAD superfamily